MIPYSEHRCDSTCAALCLDYTLRTVEYRRSPEKLQRDFENWTMAEIIVYIPPTRRNEKRNATDGQ